MEINIQPGYGRVRPNGTKKGNNNVIFALFALMGASLLFSLLAFFICIVSLVK